MHVSFILCPIPLLFLTSEVFISLNIKMISFVNQGTGETHFLVEVEDGETESINADNGPNNDADNGPNNGDVGSREDVDEDGRKAGQASIIV